MTDRFDLVAAKHSRDVLGQAAGAGELPQQTQRLAGNPLLGVIEIQAGGLGM